jgi:hypothetical protein
MESYDPFSFTGTWAEIVRVKKYLKLSNKINNCKPKDYNPKSTDTNKGLNE